MIDARELARKVVSEMIDRDIEVLFIGTTEQLLPSSKQYLPWKAIDVTKEELEADTEWWREFDDELAKYDAWSDVCEEFPLEVRVIMSKLGGC
jgi:hypothetical protein